ncbi:Hypothetical protein KP2612_000449 [Komagataella phaffii]
MWDYEEVEGNHRGMLAELDGEHMTDKKKERRKEQLTLGGFVHTEFVVVDVDWVAESGAAVADDDNVVVGDFDAELELGVGWVTGALDFESD